MLPVNDCWIAHVLPHLDHKQIKFDHVPLFLSEILLFYADGFYLFVDTPLLQELYVLEVVALFDLLSVFGGLVFVVLLEEGVVEDVLAGVRWAFSGFGFLFELPLLGQHLLVVRIVLRNDIADLLQAQMLIVNQRRRFCNTQIPLPLHLSLFLRKWRDPFQRQL